MYYGLQGYRETGGEVGARPSLHAYHLKEVPFGRRKRGASHFFMIFEMLTAGVITAGSGRGFVVEGVGERLVITAAHCLPFLPPAQSFFRAQSTRLRTAPRPPRGRTSRMGGVSFRRSDC